MSKRKLKENKKLNNPAFQTATLEVVPDKVFRDVQQLKKIPLIFNMNRKIPFSKKNVSQFDSYKSIENFVLNQLPSLINQIAKAELIYREYLAASLSWQLRIELQDSRKSSDRSQIMSSVYKIFQFNRKTIPIEYSLKKAILDLFYCVGRNDFSAMIWERGDTNLRDYLDNVCSLIYNVKSVDCASVRSEMEKSKTKNSPGFANLYLFKNEAFSNSQRSLEIAAILIAEHKLPIKKVRKALLALDLPLPNTEILKQYMSYNGIKINN